MASRRVALVWTVRVLGAWVACLQESSSSANPLRSVFRLRTKILAFLEGKMQWSEGAEGFLQKPHLETPIMFSRCLFVILPLRLLILFWPEPTADLGKRKIIHIWPNYHSDLIMILQTVSFVKVTSWLASMSEIFANITNLTNGAFGKTHKDVPVRWVKTTKLAFQYYCNSDTCAGTLKIYSENSLTVSLVAGEKKKGAKQMASRVDPWKFSEKRSAGMGRGWVNTSPRRQKDN